MRALLAALLTLILLSPDGAAANLRQDFLRWMGWSRSVTHLSLAKVRATLRERQELSAGMNHWDVGNFLFVLRMEGRGEDRDLAKRLRSLAERRGLLARAQRWRDRMLEKHGIRCPSGAVRRTNGDRWPPVYRCDTGRTREREGEKRRRELELRRRREAEAKRRRELELRRRRELELRRKRETEARRRRAAAAAAAKRRRDAETKRRRAAAAAAARRRRPAARPARRPAPRPSVARATPPRRSTAPSWKTVPGALAQVSVGKAGRVWGVNRAGMVFRWASGRWQRIPGVLRHVSVGSDGTVWGVNPGGIAWQWTGRRWRRMPGKFRQVAVGSASVVWAVGTNGAIHRWDRKRWKRIPGWLRQVAVGGDGTVWGINHAGQVFRWAGNRWLRVGGNLASISVGGARHVWGVNRARQVFRWTGSRWTLVAGKLVSVAVGADGTAWGLGPGGRVFRRVAPAAVAVAPSRRPAALRPAPRPPPRPGRPTPRTARQPSVAPKPAIAGRQPVKPGAKRASPALVPGGKKASPAPPAAKKPSAPTAAAKLATGAPGALPSLVFPKPVLDETKDVRLRSVAHFREVCRKYQDRHRRYARLALKMAARQMAAESRDQKDHPGLAALLSVRKYPCLSAHGVLEIQRELLAQARVQKRAHALGVMNQVLAQGLKRFTYRRATIQAPAFVGLTAAARDGLERRLDVGLRGRALVTMAAVGGERIIPLARSHLTQSKDPVLRLSGAEALVAIGTPKAFQALSSGVASLGAPQKQAVVNLVLTRSPKAAQPAARVFLQKLGVRNTRFTPLTDALTGPLPLGPVGTFQGRSR